MANVPGLSADVYFGAVGKPLPDWRKTIGPSRPDDDEPTEADRKAVIAILGFDPREIDDETSPERRTQYCGGESACGCEACQAKAAPAAPRKLRLIKGTGGRVRIMYARATQLRRVDGKLISHRNKSGDPKCSHAVSQWKRKQATPETFKTLAHCRQLAQKQAASRSYRARGMEARAQVVESRVVRGTTNVATREYLAKQARKERDRKRIARAANRPAGQPTSPAELRAQNERFQKNMAGGRKIALKPSSPEHQRAARAVADTLNAREDIQRAILREASPEGVGVLRRQAETKYRQAQQALKAAGVRRRAPGQAVTPPSPPKPKPSAPMPQPQPQPTKAAPTKAATDFRGNKYAVLRMLLKDQIRNQDAIGRAYDRHGPDSPEHQEATREYDRVERQIGQVAGTMRVDRHDERRRKLAAQKPPQLSGLEQRIRDREEADRREREGFEQSSREYWAAKEKAAKQSAPPKPKRVTKPKANAARPAPRPPQGDPILERHNELAKERAQIHEDHARAIQTRREHGSTPEIERRLDQIRERSNRNRVELMTIQGHHGKHLRENGAQLINLTSPYIDPAWRGSPARGGGRTR